MALCAPKRVQLRRFEPFDDLRRDQRPKGTEACCGKDQESRKRRRYGRGCERVADGTFFLVGVDLPISVALVNDLLIHLDFC